jgi:protein-tyrosine phosphatase
MKPSSPLLPGTFNSRDLGGLHAYGGRVRPGLLVRSDAPIAIGDAGRAILRDLRLATAMDLREPIERKLDPPDFDGIRLELVSRPILGGDFKLHAGMTMEQVYRTMLDERGANLTAAVRSLARPGALPALVFCSAGKDRTGLVTALVLGALGVPDDEIVADYTRTEENMNGTFRAAVEARANAAGISEQELAAKVGAPPALMRSSLAWIRERHRGTSGYLRSHGMTNTELETLRRTLVAPRAANAA